MIRKATEDDLPTVLAIVDQYFSEYGFSAQSGISLDPDSVLAAARICMNKGVLLIEDNTGVAGGTISPAFGSNHNTKVMQENIVYGSPELAEAFYKCAKELGAQVSIRSCYVPASGSRFRRL